MHTYRPPIDSMTFVIGQVLEATRDWQRLPALSDCDDTLAREVLQQAGRFAAGVLAPLNGPGDLQGCRWSDGVVKTPDGYAAAWRRFVEDGWPALSCDAEDGGQGLPYLLNVALFEMLAAANHGWTMYPGVQRGAYETLRAAATPELRRRYLPEVVSGTSLFTMNLTEPQAGSDLGLLRCRAEPVLSAPVGNGAAVRISGTKIFISGGEHDLTGNIIHLVLARLPDAPPGTRGLSLFLVPKRLPDGTLNSVHCDGIEDKMGIHGSATCQMRFADAAGWLLGEPGGGLAAMFLMMNAARLSVGVQGLGHLEAATQIAEAYAQERRQSRAPGSSAGPDLIAAHPSMRRILLDLRCQTEAGRVLAYWTGQQLDRASHLPNGEERDEARDLVALLTPVVKAFLTQLGHQGADRALGVLGGFGYLHGYRIEQHVRDSRVAMIYEGTNEIQAIDLLQRKVLDRPQRLQALLRCWESEVAALGSGAGADHGAAGLFTAWRKEMSAQIDQVSRAADALRAGMGSDPERPFRVAEDFLQGLGHALFAWAWMRLLRVAFRQDDAALRERIVTLAEHGRLWLLPAARVHWQRVMADDLPLAAIATSGG